MLQLAIMVNRLLSGDLYGNILKRVIVSDLTLTETQYIPYLTIPKHSHDYAYFCFVLKGTYTENYEQKSRFCEPSALILHPQGEEHSDRFHNFGGHCFNIQLSQRLLNHVNDYSKFLNQPLYFNVEMLAKLVKKLYKEFYNLDNVSPLIIEGIVLEIIAQTSRQNNRVNKHKPPQWLKLAKELIQDQFHEQLNLNNIAKQVNIHPVHLAREFQRHYQITVGEYIRQLRIDFSCKELALTDTPIAEIALKAGFYDQSHFCKTFKCFTGYTPVEFRAISRPR